MAQPEKVTFYSSDPDLHVGLTHPLGEAGEVMVFKDGKFEATTDRQKGRLDRLAETPDLPFVVSRRPPSKDSSK